LKKSEHDDLDRELITVIAKVSPEWAKAIISAAPLKVQAPNKRRKGRKQSPQPHQPTTKERIYRELDQTGFGYATAREWLAASILPPHPKIDWTQTLEGYEAARVSAENAMRRIWAATSMAQAGYEGDPWLGTCLFKMRVGMVQRDHRDVLRCVQHAQKIGKAEWFSERLAEETKNAKIRVRGAPWFNRFRALLVNSWLSHGFWLMSDDLIARVVQTLKFKPTGCTRQTITKAVKELGLVKHPDTARKPIVKDIGTGGKFIFREGYPPQS
jgi:hypothetical protein